MTDQINFRFRGNALSKIRYYDVLLDIKLVATLDFGDHDDTESARHERMLLTTRFFAALSKSRDSDDTK